jgi:hypothetical protein
MVLALAFAGCGGWDAGESSSAAGIVALDPPAPLYGELLVYERGIMCVVAPCPTHRVVDRTGRMLDVALIDQPVAVGLARAPLAPMSAFVVEGKVELGDWRPGGTGNILHVAALLGAPPSYLAYRLAQQHAIEAETHGCIRDDHRKGLLGGLDLAPLRLSLQHEPAVREDIERSRTIVSAWQTAPEDGSPGTLIVTGLVAEPTLVRVRDNGFRCITMPCPSIAVLGPNGHELGPAASIDFTAMQLAPAEQASLLAAVMSGMPLRAWLVDGSWSPFETGAVLYGTDVPSKH